MRGQDPLRYALYLLGRRSRTIFELKNKLLDKGYEPEQVKETLKRLTEMKLLNDQEYAQNYARDKTVIYRRGRHRIGLELLQKGVAKETIQEALGTIQENEELQAAQTLLTARERQWHDLDARKRFERAISLLQRRGFSGKVVRQAMESLK